MVSAKLSRMALDDQQLPQPDPSDRPRGGRRSTRRRPSPSHSRSTRGAPSSQAGSYASVLFQSPLCGAWQTTNLKLGTQIVLFPR